MLDIPLNKALVAVETERLGWQDTSDCADCVLEEDCSGFLCFETDREDGKDVIFKLVDLPEGKTQ